jgi:hypothetical protein
VGLRHNCRRRTSTAVVIGEPAADRATDRIRDRDFLPGGAREPTEFEEVLLWWHEIINHVTVLHYDDGLVKSLRPFVLVSFGRCD